MLKIILIFFLFISLNLFSQNDFKKEIDNIYNFEPHKLNKSEQEKLFPILDLFFEKVKSDTAKYLPLLRNELKSNDHFPYFYYDCSQLLMMSSESISDKEICAKAFVKTDIIDLDPKQYLNLIRILAKSQINVTSAAVKILEKPFSFYLPKHAMTFNQGYCLLYSLLPINPNLYVDTLISIFKLTKDTLVQYSIITVLWFSYTCKGDEFLLSLNKNNTLSIEISDYSKRILNQVEISDEHYKQLSEKITINELEDLIKSALNSYSDEAIDDLDFVVKVFRKRYKCK